jgi:tRNA/rRNA methyltransferase
MPAVPPAQSERSRVEKGRLSQRISGAAPAVILVQPQLAENMGTAARAMMNCGLSDLRLVDPNEDWLNERAVAASSGAERILECARRFTTTEEAIGDLEVVYATTARQREMVKPVMTARAAAAHMRAEIGGGQRVGILFGRERSGLTNHEVALANVVVEVPMNPEHSSLNLAQAVLIVGYEWFQAGYAGPQAMVSFNKTRLADKDMLEGFFRHLEEELTICGFLRNDEKKPSMVINIRNMFQRAELTEQDVRTLHGIVKELRYGRRPDRPKRQPGYKTDEN